MWHARYMGVESPAVAKIARDHQRDFAPALYLFARVEGSVFVQDGIRDGEEARHDMDAHLGAALCAAAFHASSWRGTGMRGFGPPWQPLASLALHVLETHNRWNCSGGEAELPDHVYKVIL